MQCFSNCPISINAMTYASRLFLTSLNFLLAGLKIASLGLTYPVDDSRDARVLYCIVGRVNTFEVGSIIGDVLCDCCERKSR